MILNRERIINVGEGEMVKKGTSYVCSEEVEFFNLF